MTLSPMAIILLISGGILAVEGAIWAIMPTQFRKVYQDAFKMGDKNLHIMGLVSVALGVACIVLGLKG